MLAMFPSAAAAQSGTPAPQPSPSAAASPASSSVAPPSASPSPSPRPGTLRWRADAHLTFVSASSSGPGTSPPEGPGFAAGSPISPLTPYDVFSSAPLVPGNAAESALYLRPDYFGRGFDASLVLGAGYVRGSVTNAAYWGEPLLPAMNPHLGAQKLPYAVVFPLHAGGDDGTAFVASVISGRVATKDGNLALRGGWFDLAQADAFTFVQPAVTGVAPSIGLATPETLGDGLPNLDAWTPAANVLPLHGIDAVAKRGLATFELADAALPSLPGTGARLRIASLSVDHGEGTRYSAQILRVTTGGDLVATTVLFGAGGGLIPSPQGPLPSTLIGGQRQTIGGARAAFHATHSTDAVIEYGRSTYDADHVASPGSGKAGNYYHLGAARAFGPAAIALDVYRNESYYATALLPYGAPENVWSVAWSWPGQWLKSNYQLINDFPVNVDRQGYRAKYTLKTNALDLRATYANFGQIDPISHANAVRTGFVDGFFLPQADGVATLGRQHQYGFYAAWHPAFGDVSLDYAEDTMRRPYAPGQPQDHVSYATPAYAVMVARRMRPALLATLGYQRYAMRGSFGQGFTNVDFAQRAGIAGVEWAASPRSALLASVRRSAFTGLPAAPGGPPPDFTATLVTLEQRYRF